MDVIDSMLEIAMKLMEKKRKAHTLANLAKEVFEIKGLKINENLELYSQFINDFMLCGYFICCGEDKKGVKMWNIKSREKFELLEKDGVFEDPYEDDEDVINNELKDETDYKKDTEFDLDYMDDSDDDDDKEEESDEIEEELRNMDDFALDNDLYDEDDDDDDDYDDKD